MAPLSGKSQASSERLLQHEGPWVAEWPTQRGQNGSRSMGQGNFYFESANILIGAVLVH
jgi:hypothetical protein